MDIYTVSITAKNTQINLKDFEIINNFPPYFNATVLVYPMKTLSLEVICRYSANKEHLTGTVPVNKYHLTCTLSILWGNGVDILTATS